MGSGPWIGSYLDVPSPTSVPYFTNFRRPSITSHQAVAHLNLALINSSSSLNRPETHSFLVSSPGSMTFPAFLTPVWPRSHARNKISSRIAQDKPIRGTKGVPIASAAVSTEVPLLVRAGRGEPVPRPPVWMMRQAGRYMKVYQELAKKHPSFRERSEIPELSIEISLQPWRAFKPDGVILFSDILTPLPGMGVPFDIPDRGPVIDPPLRTKEQIDAVHELDCEKTAPFVKETLQALRKEVDGQAAVLGFVGAPYTLATYCIEGGSSKSYTTIKKMAYTEPQLLHTLLSKFADNIADYCIFQIDSGAQVVQMFDSWAGQLAPMDYDVFAAPYQKRVVDRVKKAHPDVPFILYISQGGTLLERMAGTGVDIVSVDWTVDMADARKRLGSEVMVQGNLDPAILLGSKALIKDRTLDVIRKAGRTGHICNLGHGVYPATPEENVECFFKTVQEFSWE